MRDCFANDRSETIRGRHPRPRASSLNGENVLLIRAATPTDGLAVMRIFNQAVLDTTAVWSDHPSDLSAREEWIASRSIKGLPVIVCEIDYRIVGFAALSDFRPLDGYQFTKEDSVFVDVNFHRRGIGRALLTSLLQEAHQIKAHAIVAAIDAENLPSIALHSSLGFREVGKLPQVGRKFGKWLDLVYMQILV